MQHVQLQWWTGRLVGDILRSRVHPRGANPQLPLTSQARMPMPEGAAIAGKNACPPTTDRDTQEFLSPYFMRIDLPSPPRRVLIIKPSAIGDVVHTLPVLALLRRRWPGARVDWLVTPACAGLLEGHPLLHEVIRFERKEYGAELAEPADAGGAARVRAGAAGAVVRPGDRPAGPVPQRLAGVGDAGGGAGGVVGTRGRGRGGSTRTACRSGRRSGTRSSGTCA